MDLQPSAVDAQSLLSTTKHERAQTDEDARLPNIGKAAN
jgi:hypothetical protein